MGKKIIYLLLILTVLALGVYLAIHFYGHQGKPLSGAIELVPDNAALILQTNNFREFSSQLTKKNNFWGDLDSIPAFTTLNNNLTEIVKPFSKQPTFKNILNKTPILISAHISGKADFSLVFYIKRPIGISQKQVKDFLKKNYFTSATISKRDYDSKQIINISQQGKSEIFYTFIKNVFVVSHSSLLLEAVIRQSETKYNLLTNKQFKEVDKTAGKNVLANLYINFSHFSKFSSIFMNDIHRNHLKNLNIGDWCELDLNIKKSVIMMNGFMNSTDSIFRYINLFKRQSPIDNEMEEVLPSRTVAFVHLGISDIQKFQQDYNQYLSDEGLATATKKHNDAIKKKYGFDLQSVFYSIFEEEVALVFEHSQHADVYDDAYVVFKTASQRLAREKLLKVLKKHATIFGNDFNSYLHNYQLDKETSYPIYSMPFPKVFKYIFGNIFSKFSGNYFTFVNNYLVFASSQKGLSKFIVDNVRQQTLDKELTYMDFKENLSNRSNFYFFSTITPATDLFSYYFNQDLSKVLIKNKERFNKIYGLGYQFSGNNKMLYNSIVLYYNADVKEKPHTVWETHLDTSILFKPRLVTNYKTMQKEIFVQDVRNNIYLINASGRILWKLHLNEPIMSDVYQVDAYKNNKLQYLFNTRHKIYLIDRNGNNVENFPVNLRSPATNGIAVFDYDGSRDYRIFIAGQDNHIYLYNLIGNILPGWTFGNTDNPVVMPVQHFRIETKDFIVFADSLKTYIVNRRGENLFSVSKYFAKSRNNPFYLYHPYGKIEGNYLVTTDRNGKVYFIDFKGNVTVKEFSSFSPNHYFVLEDIDRNSKPDFLFLDKNKLTVYNNKKEALFSHEFDNNIASPPIIFTFPNNICKIGISNNLVEKVFLFNADGSLYKDFPLEGNSPFSIGHFDNSSLRFNLLVGGKGNFLYNYAVN